MKRYVIAFAAFGIASYSFSTCGAKHVTKTDLLKHVRFPTQEIVKLHAKNECSEGMVLVDGDYCPDLVQTCIKERKRDPNVKNANHAPAVCEKFSEKVTCLSKPNQIKHLHFCIDKYERSEKDSNLPRVYVSWIEAKNTCESEGKRLPTYEEWVKAAEGPRDHPLAYGDGFTRDKTKCAIDKLWRDPWKNSFKDIDQREPVDARSSDCVSDYGVVNMSGNVDEWCDYTQGSMHHEPWRSGLVGGHMLGVRNTSRAVTTSHEPTWSWYVQGFRCVK